MARAGGARTDAFERAFEAAVAEHRGGNLTRAIAQYERGEFEAAERFYRDAHARAPNHIDTLNALGVVLKDPDRRLRVGYLSPDLRTHPVSVFFEPVLAHHDARQCDVYCYSTTRAPDGIETYWRNPKAVTARGRPRARGGFRRS